MRKWKLRDEHKNQLYLGSDGSLMKQAHLTATIFFKPGTKTGIMISAR